MAKAVKKKSQFKKKATIVIAIAVVLGLPILLLATQQTTEIRQHASQFNDINSSYAITQTTNADGTMGPASSWRNYSNSFPFVYLGTLNFQVTDPEQGRPPVIPTHMMPTQAQQGGGGDQNAGSRGNGNVDNGNIGMHGQPSTTPGNSQNNGPQTLSSLLLTVSKVEVHLAHVGIPGTKNEEVSPTPQPSGQPSGVPGLNQGVNKWETLSISAPQTIDLVQLAKTHNFTSLGLTKLVNGRYTEIRLYVSTASATLQNGQKVSLVIPGRENIVRVVQSFVIDSNKTTTLTMDFDAQNSVIKVGDQYLLKPVVAHLIEQ